MLSHFGLRTDSHFAADFLDLIGLDRIVVCCGVRGRALASHTGVPGCEPQRGDRLPSLIC